MVSQSYGINWHNNDATLCFIGGLLIGVIAAIRMLLFGKVTGISGFVQGAFIFTHKSIKETGLFDTKRIVSITFLASIVAGGAICNVYIPACFEDWGSLPVGRLVVAAVLVGFGTKKGNGCTSGHGVCGISAFRNRSIVATCLFMTAAMVTAMAADTSHYLPYFINEVDVETSGAIIGICMAASLGCAVLSHTISSQEFSKPWMSNPTFSLIFTVSQEIVYGISFGLATGVSNMTKLSATIAFLDLRYWNPALAFVMCGAIAVTTTSFFFTFKRDRPLLDTKFYHPTMIEIDKNLVIGSTIFGVGWGLAGVCPGPAMTNLGSGNIPPVIYMSCCIGGMLMEHLTVDYFDLLMDKCVEFGLKMLNINKISNFQSVANENCSTTKIDVEQQLDLGDMFEGKNDVIL